MVLLLNFKKPVSLILNRCKKTDVSVGRFLVGKIVFQFPLSFIVTCNTVIELLTCPVENLVGICDILLPELQLPIALVLLVCKQLIVPDLLIVDGGLQIIEESNCCLQRASRLNLALNLG